MAEIAAMAADLEAHLHSHARAAVQSAIDTSKQIEDQVAAMASPAYGVGIRTRMEPLEHGAKVDVEVFATDGIGHVMGGMRAAEKSIAAHIEDVAKGGGFDRRG